METVSGDLIKLAKEGDFDVIVHGCNCFCSMGAGIATQIRNSFPEAYDADLKTEKGNKSKLGSCSVGVSKVKKKSLIVLNAYTQFRPGGKGVEVDYEALRKCMKWIKQKYSGKRIGLPKIGAGLAGGDWKCIKKIIRAELKGVDVTIVEHQK